MKTLIFIIVVTFALVISVTAQNPCPTITVDGPKGLTPIGETMTFTAKIEGIDLDRIKFEWIVNGGSISRGQGTATIIVPINADMAGQIITATVEISGLPQNCSNAVSGAGEVEQKVGGGVPRAIDDYERISWKEERKRLKMVINEINNYSELMVMFIISKPSNENLKNFKLRLTRIGKYLTKTHNIAKDRVRFTVINSSNYGTKIYLPPMFDYGEVTTWEQDIDRIFPKNLPKKKLQPKQK